VSAFSNMSIDGGAPRGQPMMMAAMPPPQMPVYGYPVMFQPGPPPPQAASVPSPAPSPGTGEYLQAGKPAQSKEFDFASSNARFNKPQFEDSVVSWEFLVLKGFLTL
jgi:hypothetical protein